MCFKNACFSKTAVSAFRESFVKKSKLVSAVIIGLIALFALLIVYTLISRNLPAPEAGSAQNGARQSAVAPNGAAETARTGGQQGESRAGAQARGAAVVRITPVALGTIENSVVINGDVLAGNQVSILPAAAGKLVEARLKVGDRVGRGDVVAMVDPSRPGEVYSLSPVISTISGTVLQAPYSVGETLSTQSAVYVVGDLSGLRVETFVPERFVSSVRPGLAAELRLEAIPGETFRAEVDEVSPVLDPASRTLRIRLRFAWDSSGRIDGRIKAGMFATLSLVTNTRSGVPVIPRSAVINTYGSWIVFVVDENSVARRRSVELGIENENFFEITGGLELGEPVVSQGQNFLSDGDPVRIIE
jgi:multidrug efflux pump subunit AcrA (membrane-fusion protein)